MQLVDRVLKAIEALSQEEAGMSVSDLAEALEIPVSSAHRVLRSLLDNHFVIQNPETRQYRLSYKIITLCSNMKAQNSLIVQARPYMKELAEELQKNVVLCVMSGDKIINLDCIENSDSSIYMVKIGKELPLYSTSAGRVFAAYMEEGRVREIFENTERTLNTPYTKTNIEELFSELRKIREQEYAVIDEELQMGIQGVSCPIKDCNGQVFAALAVTTLKTKDTVDRELIGKLKACADRISQSMV